MKDPTESPYPAVGERQRRQKELLIEQLRRTPIVQIACEKVGVSRASFYRWRRDDPVFADEAENAVYMGVSLVNDLAESQLISGIRDRNMTAIIFWLKHRHRAYGTRVDVNASLKVERKLSDEERETIRKAIRLASLTADPDEYDQ
ncbi:MAG: phBC6A51 family helix-turn-helix protein [bacterium]